MNKYTKGEWEILSDGLTIKAKIEYKPHYDAEPPQTFIAKCFQNGHLGRSKRPTEEDLANACLIVTAPNLLERLEKTTKYLEIHTKKQSKYSIPRLVDKIIEENKAAIAKTKVQSKTVEE